MGFSKAAMTVSSLAVAGLFGGGIFLLMNMGSIAEKISERLATEALGVEVSIDKMDVSLQNKQVIVHGLRIANPPGYKKSHAMSVKKIDVALGNVSKDLIVFKNIIVDGTDVNMEVTEKGTNLSAIKNGMKKQPAKPAANEGEASNLKVIIDKFSLTKANLKPSVTLVSDEDLTSVTVPDIHLTDIGRKENGVLVKEAIAQIWSHVSRRLNQAAGSAGFLSGVSPESLKDMGVSGVRSITDRISDEAESIGDGIKSLFE